MKKAVVIKQKQFSGIKRNPSLLGFGLMRLPVQVNDPEMIDETTAEKMIDFAYSYGVTYFDTAYPYHQGQSELFIGKALKKYPRDSFYLATKMPGWLVQSESDARRIFAEQLTRCQVDYFDYYLCHALNRHNVKAYQNPGVLDFLLEMKQKGKIRHLGFSFHDTPEELAKILAMTSWDFVQIQLNYLDWNLQKAKEQYDLIEKANLPCIVMEPIRGGLLATLSSEARDIFRTADPHRSIASWALRYAASKPNVMVVLSGMSTVEQTLDNLETMTDFQPITAKEQLLINRALAAFKKNRLIPCTGCEYCLPCPHGVNIPANFRWVNEYNLHHSDEEFLLKYQRMAIEEQASACQSCQECVSKCPQRIAIPEELAKIASKIDEIIAKQREEQTVKKD